jgi:hypothetical protein
MFSAMNSVFCTLQCQAIAIPVNPATGYSIPACCSAQLRAFWFAFLASYSVRRVGRAALISQSAVANYIVTGAYVVRGVCCCCGRSSPCACCAGMLCECAVSAIRELERRLIVRWSWIRMTIVS